MPYREGNSETREKYVELQKIEDQDHPRGAETQPEKTREESEAVVRLKKTDQIGERGSRSGRRAEKKRGGENQFSS